MASLVLEPSTGRVVDLTGLSNGERLLCDVIAAGDPRTYMGWTGCDCLFGQLEQRRTGGLVGSDPLDIALRYGTDPGACDDVWRTAGQPEYQSDWHAAVAMAAEALGVAPAIRDVMLAAAGKLPA